MLHFHDSAALQREVGVHHASAPEFRSCAVSDYYAGYCLDAPDRSPAGSTWRVEPLPDSRYPVAPFAAAMFAHYR